jgi:hypothetical protein
LERYNPVAGGSGGRNCRSVVNDEEPCACPSGRSVVTAARTDLPWNEIDWFSSVAVVGFKPPTMVFSQQEDAPLTKAASDAEFPAGCRIAPPAAIVPQHAMSAIRHVWSTTVNPELAAIRTTASARRPRGRYFPALINVVIIYRKYQIRQRRI